MIISHKRLNSSHLIPKLDPNRGRVVLRVITMKRYSTTPKAGASPLECHSQDSHGGGERGLTPSAEMQLAHSIATADRTQNNNKLISFYITLGVCE